MFEQIITILGPTATGKTNVAVALAKELDAEIVSADSRQVYRGMDIGTGKDIAEYQIDGVQIPYHLIDIAEPGVEYNVFQYQQTAIPIIKDIQRQDKTVILCGGSGMYIDALLKGYKLFPVPENSALRVEWESRSDAELETLLSSFRPLHNKTDIETRERLYKALEIEYYYQDHPELSAISQAVPSIIFGFCGDRNLIRSKITARLKQRLKEGMINEVQQLINQGVSQEQLIRYGLEYKFITWYLTGKIDYQTMFDRLNVAIHQFSKRQMTWFRKMERDGFKIHWIDISLLMEKKVLKMRELIDNN
jgi:tRNA dimethylallyltransferase